MGRILMIIGGVVAIAIVLVVTVIIATASKEALIIGGIFMAVLLIAWVIGLIEDAVKSKKRHME